MKKHITYTTKGTCSRQIDIIVDGDVIEEARFTGGCHGNTQGISKLVRGMKVDDVIERLEGTVCGFKSTSCPDQLARALKESKKEN